MNFENNDRDRRASRGTPHRASHLVIAIGLATLSAAPALADSEVSLAVGADAGLMFSRTVRRVSDGRFDDQGMGMIGLSGRASFGRLLLGLDAAGATGLGHTDGFAGASIGEQFRRGRNLFLLTAESGAHAIASVGSDSSHNSDAPTVVLPYVGARLQVGHLINRRLLLGASVFVRTDLTRQTVTASVTQTCDFLDFDCENPSIPTAFAVGGTSGGIAFSLSW